MSTASREALLDQLFGTSRKSQAQKSGNELAFWEKELVESRQEKAQTASPRTADDETGDLPSLEDDHIPFEVQQKSPSVPQKPELIPGTEPDQIVYLPKGRQSGGVYASELDINDEDYESDTEPISSSNELVGQFCIFSQVTKFVYKYMQDPESRVSRRFFSGAKIYERGWNMHYLFGTDSYTYKPLMLVPLLEVQNLIEEIKDEFKINVNVPEYPFQISFYNDGMPSPTCIGRVNSKRDMLEVQSSIPTASEQHGILPTNPTECQIQDHAAWEVKLDRAFEKEKKKSASKRRKAERRRERNWGQISNSLKRAQRYLGLRQTSLMTESISSDGPELQHPNNTHVEPLHLSSVAPFPFEGDTVIISFDVEAWEMDHSAVTEIGVSILDTADIKSIAPGSLGEEWIKKIRSRHFRIKGRECLRNFKFCQDNPDMFQFGTSEFVTMGEAPGAVDSCFEHPYLDRYECEGPPRTDEHGRLITRAPVVPNQPREPGDNPPRTLLLVGHDIVADLNYLSSLGSTIFGTKPLSSSNGNPSRRQLVLGSIQERFDTATLYQALTKDAQARSLTKVCEELGIEAWYPHNAGNDARYTLEAFIKIAINSRQQDDGQDFIPRKIGISDNDQHSRAEVGKETAKTGAVDGNQETERPYQSSGEEDGSTTSSRPTFEYSNVTDASDEEGGGELSSDEFPY